MNVITLKKALKEFPDDATVEIHDEGVDLNIVGTHGEPLGSIKIIDGEDKDVE